MRPAICKPSASRSQATAPSSTVRMTGWDSADEHSDGSPDPARTPFSQVAVSFLRSLRAALFMFSRRRSRAKASLSQLPVGGDGFVADEAPEAVVQEGEIGRGGFAR